MNSHANFLKNFRDHDKWKQLEFVKKIMECWIIKQVEVVYSNNKRSNSLANNWGRVEISHFL